MEDEELQSGLSSDGLDEVDHGGYVAGRADAGEDSEL